MKGDGRGPGPRSRSPMPILFSESRTKLGPAMAESEGTWVGEGTADRDEAGSDFPGLPPPSASTGCPLAPICIIPGGLSPCCLNLESVSRPAWTLTGGDDTRQVI